MLIQMITILKPVKWVLWVLVPFASGPKWKQDSPVFKTQQECNEYVQELHQFTHINIKETKCLPMKKNKSA